MSEHDRTSLTFEIQETIFLDKDTSGIEELREVELVPEVEILEEGDAVRITGCLYLNGEYEECAAHKQETDREHDELSEAVHFRPFEAEESAFSAWHKNRDLHYRMPVNISIPSERIDDANDIFAVVDSFDYEIKTPHQLLIKAHLILTGVHAEAGDKIENTKFEDKHELEFVHAAGEPSEEKTGPPLFSPSNNMNRDEPAASKTDEPSEKETSFGSEASLDDEDVKPREEVEVKPEKKEKEEEPEEKAKPEAENDETETEQEIEKKEEDNVIPLHQDAVTGPKALDESDEREESETEAQDEEDTGVKVSISDQGSQEEKVDLTSVFGKMALSQKMKEAKPEAAEASFEEEETAEETAFSGEEAGAEDEEATDLERMEAEEEKETPEKTEAEADEKENEEAETAEEDATYLTNFMGEEEEQFTRVKMCIVQKGETLHEIADRYELDADMIAATNKLETQQVTEGQVIWIPKT